MASQAYFRESGNTSRGLAQILEKLCIYQTPPEFQLVNKQLCNCMFSQFADAKL